MTATGTPVTSLTAAFSSILSGGSNTSDGTNGQPKSDVDDTRATVNGFPLSALNLASRRAASMRWTAASNSSRVDAFSPSAFHPRTSASFHEPKTKKPNRSTSANFSLTGAQHPSSLAAARVRQTLTRIDSPCSGTDLKPSSAYGIRATLVYPFLPTCVSTLHFADHSGMSTPLLNAVRAPAGFHANCVDVRSGFFSAGPK